jgi:hypothetical protein
MAARLLQRGRQAQHLVPRRAVRRHHRGERRLALGERAGLVEGDHRDACATSSASASLMRMPWRAATPGAGHDGRRRGQPQRAGAGDDQHRHRVDERLFPVTREAEAPAQQGEQRDDQHHRHEHRADAVDDALDRRLPAWADSTMRMMRASVVSAPMAVVRTTSSAFGVDGAAGDLVAHALGHRQALAGDQRFVDLAAAFDDVTVDRDAVAGAHDDEVADHDLATGTSTRRRRARTRAVVGRSAFSARMASVVCRLARASSHLPSSTSVMTAAEASKYRCGMPCAAVLEQQVDRQPVGRARCPAPPAGPCCRSWRARPSSRRGRSASRARTAPAWPAPAAASRQHPVDAEELQQHRQHQRQRQRAQGRIA